MLKKSNLLKRTVARLLLFGIPFALSYWATRPVSMPSGPFPYVVCATPSDLPGELQISLGANGCANAVKLVPTVRSVPEDSLRDRVKDKHTSLPF